MPRTKFGFPPFTEFTSSAVLTRWSLFKPLRSLEATIRKSHPVPLLPPLTLPSGYAHSFIDRLSSLMPVSHTPFAGTQKGRS